MNPGLPAPVTLQKRQMAFSQHPLAKWFLKIQEVHSKYLCSICGTPLAQAHLEACTGCIACSNHLPGHGIPQQTASQQAEQHTLQVLRICQGSVQSTATTRLSRRMWLSVSPGWIGRHRIHQCYIISRIGLLLSSSRAGCQQGTMALLSSSSISQMCMYSLNGKKAAVGR